MKKHYALLTTLLFLVYTISVSQTYNGAAGPIVDDGTNNIYTLDITNLVPETLTPEFGLKAVCLHITHSWMADLDIRLTAPDGTTLLLTSTLGGDQDGYINTCFRQDATLHILDGGAPFTGLYRPFSPIGNVNNGQIGNGRWTLHILDTYAYADAGDVISWSLTFGFNAPEPKAFESTFLPIILLTTDDQMTPPDNPKIRGRIRTIHNNQGLANHLTDTPSHDSDMGIEVRGASSQSFPKKSFGIETWDSEGADLEVPLLGLPKEEDWILYAPYTDKSLLRDALTYKLGRDMGHYASRTVFCELFLNGDYQGIYCLEEKIKRDKNRVNITRLNVDDISGDAVTGGYLLKVDRDDGPGSYFVSEYEGTYPAEEIRFVYEDPEGPELVPEQRAYIEGFCDDFERALYGTNFMDPSEGYRAYLDVPSFIDFFLVSELGHNVDAYRLSTFLYKDRDSVDPLMHAGPLWDFNLSYGNVDYCNCQFTEGWAYQNSGGCGNTPLWWARLLEDPAYADEMRCRYEELRHTVLHTDTLLAWVDSMVAVFNPAVTRNFQRWPIFGRYVWPNYFIGSTYQQEIDYLKNWITGRLAWMDSHLPGACKVSGTHALLAGELALYPNPAQDAVEIKSELRGLVSVTDMHGTVVFSQPFDPVRPKVDLRSLTPGMYVVSLEGEDGRMFRAKLDVLK